MIPKKCKRLAEVDFQIAVVGHFSIAEKVTRTGTPNELHYPIILSNASTGLLPENWSSFSESIIESFGVILMPEK